MELSTKQPVAAETGWRHTSAPSLPEANGSIPVPNGLRGWKAWLRWIGPGFMVAVGYMDPGNWATSLAGGAQFQYTLLSVILISNLMAIFLQALCVRLGIVTGRDLAQACHDAYPRPVGIGLWVLAEIAIAATDLAEVIGSAIALKLLFGLPLLVGVCITALDVLVILVLQGRGFRFIEALVMVLIGTIATIFGIEIVLSQPELGPVVGGLIPSSTIVFNPDALYVAIGILGATVMPHNLYLHSSIVQTRAFDRTSVEAKRLAIRHATIDSTVALMGALFINASILIVAAAVFHANGYFDVQSIEDAHALLAPLLGTGAASILFALALLASGQNSTLTGTLAGQIVMEGFLSIRLRPWLRRLITRLLAIIPAVIVTLISGERGTVGLLIASQVVLSMQLPFAVFPLLQFTGDRAKMGEFAIPRWAKILGWGIGIFIALLNVILLWQTATGL